MQFITWLDYVLLPFYIGLIYFLAKRFRDKHYPPGHLWRPYFLPALMAKLGGAIFIGLIYQYYYGGGDTSYYFLQSKVLFESFFDSPLKWLQLVLHIPAVYDGDFIEYTSRMEWYGAVNNYAVIAVAGLISIFTFNTYLPTALLFAVLSFSGIWAIFRAFTSQYPHLTRHIAIVILFIPSTIVWGSGIFKDTVCIFGMGWMIYGAFTLLIRRRLRAFDLIMMILGFYLIAVIKIYILLAFLPALGLWILFSYSAKIKSGFVRFFLKIGLAGMSAAAFMASASSFSSELGRYSLENLANTANVTQTWILQSTGDEGSSYSVGIVDLTPVGLLKSFPMAVNVTLFRPYLWEARKPIVMFNALEAFLFLLVTLKLLFRIGPGRIWRAISTDPNIQFCLIFTLIFGFAVGITSANFGSLSRYRIPCLPLYGLALVLIYYRYNDADKPFMGYKKG